MDSSTASVRAAAVCNRKIDHQTHERISRGAVREAYLDHDLRSTFAIGRPNVITELVAEAPPTLLETSHGRLRRTRQPRAVVTALTKEY